MRLYISKVVYCCQLQQFDFVIVQLEDLSDLSVRNNQKEIVKNSLIQERKQAPQYFFIFNPQYYDTKYYEGRMDRIQNTKWYTTIKKFINDVMLLQSEYVLTNKIIR